MIYEIFSIAKTTQKTTIRFILLLSIYNLDVYESYPKKSMFSKITASPFILLDQTLFRNIRPCLIIIIILHLLVLGIGCKESLIFWKAGPRTSQWVHWENSTAGCNLRRRRGLPPDWRVPCSSGGRTRRSSSSRCPQWRSRRRLCHLHHRMRNIEWTCPQALLNWSQ